MAAIPMTRTHRILAGVVVTGAVVIAAIGFAGSYAAVRELALAKGFGWFANVFPVGIDAGIVVLLSLDLLLTWLRIPFPLLRQTAWLLTAATIAFNGAAAWPDPLGVGMHAIIPVLFVVSVEAARHAIGRVADITADRHMESVRITRWILAPWPTFRLWRRMKLWELRSYDEVIRLEQERLVYQARLRARYGRAWRRRAPIEALMPLRLARFGVPLSETIPAVPDELSPTTPAPSPPAIVAPAAETAAPVPFPAQRQAAPPIDANGLPIAPWAPSPTPQPEPMWQPEPEAVQPRTAANGRRPLATGPEPEPPSVPLPDGVSREDAYFHAYRQLIAETGERPNARRLVRKLNELYGGDILPERAVVNDLRELHERFSSEMDDQYVP
ncbi:MAG: hypothetical protein QOD82_7453 [Pseudonocardiales bacterium]|nr:hypothetical protein [Pseudonocardiales bacterium]